MEKTNKVAGILSIFVTMPIWFYLLHEVLEAVQATELMWFLYWIYLPAAIVVSFVSNVLSD